MKDNTYPLVAVVVLNYQGTADTMACLAALKKLDYPDYQVIVVENGSGDDSAERIRQAHPEVILLESGENLGFSGGNNVGIRHALANTPCQFVWLLNNDAIPAPDALTALVKTAQTYPQALIGSRVLYPDGQFQRVGNRLDPWRGALKSYRESDIQDGQTVESLTGCSMLLPRPVLEIVGLLDDTYFLYFEDNDYCLRAARRGFLSRVSLQSKVYHQEGATTGRNRPLVTYYYQRNRLILMARFYPPLTRLWVTLYTPYRLIRSTMKSRGSTDPGAHRHHRAFMLAVQDFYRGITGKCPHEL